MKAIHKLGVPTAAFVAAVILGALTTGSAYAGPFCRQDVTGHMTGCGFDTMQQCKDASAGIGGDCFPDPNLAANRENRNPGNAFAYAPGRSRPAGGGRVHGNDANTND